MTTVADPSITPVLLDVMAALQTELAKVPAGPPMHYRIVPGLAAALALNEMVDECCQGVAWLRVVRITATREFPVESDDFLPEEPVSWMVTVEMAVARCGGGPGPQLAPTDAQYNADTFKLMDDDSAMRRVGATFKATSTHAIDYHYGPGGWEPLAAEGGCMGGTRNITIQVHNCDSQLAG